MEPIDEREAPAEAEIPERLRARLAELEPSLAEERDGRLAARALPIATAWVLDAVEQLDLPRYAEEARIFVQAAPVSDRELPRFARDATYWVSQRLLVDAHHELALESAAAVLEGTRARIAERADLLDAAGFPHAARAFRRLLEETADEVPPNGMLFQALALRIVEPFLADADGC
jgi:hypothetical protein